MTDSSLRFRLGYVVVAVNDVMDVSFGTIPRMIMTAVERAARIRVICNACLGTTERSRGTYHVIVQALAALTCVRTATSVSPRTASQSSRQPYREAGKLSSRRPRPLARRSDAALTAGELSPSRARAQVRNYNHRQRLSTHPRAPAC